MRATRTKRTSSEAIDNAFVVAAARSAARSRRRVLAFACALAVGSAATGCGFKLRGPQKLAFDTLYAGFAPSSPIGVEFRRQMRTADSVELVARPDTAQARLEVLNETREKEIVSFSSTGRPREYQLRLRFAFRLVDAKGKELIAPTELLLRREITTTDAQFVAKEQEEVLLYREMQSDAVDQLLRRLAAVRI